MSDIFDTFERIRFPEESCTVPNPREPEVRDSAETYLCVLVDRRFPQECRLKVLHPYTCPDIDDPSVLLYGWTDGYNVFDHYERGIHGDREKVVAWKLVEDTYSFDWL